MIHHRQQAGIDLVTLGQRLVQIHAAHHGAQIGSGQRHDGDEQVGDFIGRLARIVHLEEHHRVHAHHRVVLGDDFLARYVEHLLHHVHPVADPVDKGEDHQQARFSRLGIFAQPLHRVDEALLHHAHPHDEEDQHGKNQCKKNIFHGAHPLRFR